MVESAGLHKLWRLAGVALNSVKVPELRTEWRGFVADWHLNKGDWDCECDDNAPDWLFCKESRIHAWSELQKMFSEAVLDE